MVAELGVPDLRALYVRCGLAATDFLVELEAGEAINEVVGLAKEHRCR